MDKYFEKALPVFAEGLSETINVAMGMYSSAEYRPGDSVMLNIAVSGTYRMFINGEFFSCGPARCGHGYYRCDEYQLADVLREGSNHIAVEVTGYNVNSFYLLDQPTFVQCEIRRNGDVVAATGTGDGFVFCLPGERIRKTERYSFQRTITEAYVLKPGYAGWRTGDFSGEIMCGTECVGEKKIIGRKLPLYSFPAAVPSHIVSSGEVKCHTAFTRNWHDRSIDISEKFKGYPEDELEFCLSRELKKLEMKETDGSDREYTGNISVESGRYISVSFGKIYTGFISLDIDCAEETELYITFDERYNNRKADPLSGDSVNAVRIKAEKGRYRFQTVEPYGTQYLGYVCLSGKAVISGTSVIRYECPTEITAGFSGDETLESIWEASVNTFRQNTLDIFMDCPTRERAGWLCDSFFTSRTEKLLTGKNNTEKLFFENFALPEKFEHLPDGMLPMCYPSDHYDGVYIPNWAMWFVVQLSDHLKRGNGYEMADMLRGKVYKLLKFFEKYENEDGLLENLDSWIFVEWSKANDFVRDVNYPSNMLYSRVLECAGAMYCDIALTEKAKKVRKTVDEQSFDGKYYRDHAVRKDGRLVVCDDISETCQYYAFFFDVATPETRPELWKLLTTEFGPERKKNGKYPEIHYSNAFIGNYLRLDILSTHGLEQQCLNEMTGYFKYMADRTGTLWENDSDRASCNHGFASYAAVLIDRCTKKLSAEV